MLKRKVLQDLENWKEHSSNKALLVTGARQVGKTYIIREFAKNNWSNFIEINFLDNADAKRAIETAKNSEELFFRLSTISKKPLIPGKTIIFLDEVQVVKEIVTAIKFLCEKTEFDYILSGSMLGVELNNINSAPVGFLNTIVMYPLDFEEFCWANGVNKEVILEAKNAFENQVKIDEFAHDRLNNLLHKYIICGGMPDAVNAFIKTNNVADVRNAQESIITQYREDISKYAKNRKLVIKRIFDIMPSEISQQNKKFVVKDIEGDSHINRYENDFLWLSDANVALPTYNVTEPRYPLLTSLDKRAFKLYFSDTGLFTYLCGMDVVRDLYADRPDINFGSIYENFVAQELKTHQHQLLYYKNRKLGEIDFLVQSKNRVIPIEVKSGKGYKRHSALNNLMNISNYGIEQAMVLCNSNVKNNGKIIYMPIYMTMFI